MSDRSAPNDRRLSERIATRVDVKVSGTAYEAECSTSTVGEGGLFLMTDTPAKLNRLLKLQVQFVGDEPLQLLGTVRWRRTPEQALDDGLPTGMGISLFQPSWEAELQWSRIVRALYANLEATQAPEDERTTTDVAPGELTVTWSAAGVVQHATPSEVTLGGLRLLGPAGVERGMDVDLTLVCAYSQGSFDVKARVVEATPAGTDHCRMGLSFTSVEGSTIEDLRRFLEPSCGRLAWPYEAPTGRAASTTDEFRVATPNLYVEDPPFDDLFDIADEQIDQAA